MLGITNTLLNDKFLLQLTNQGCLPAFYYYKEIQRISASRDWFIRVQRVKNRIEKKFAIKINDDPILAINQRSKILKIRKSVLDLPMRALISPFNKHTLNEKLYIFSTADLIRDYKHEITRNQLKKRDIRFTTADHNNIRRAIIWLNWFMFDESLEKKPATPENVSLCLSFDARAVFISDGFDGLYKIAKYKKRDLKKLFDNKFSEDKKASSAFLSLASIELNSIVNFGMTPLRLENLFRCYEHFITSHRKPVEKRRMPNYYMYNPNILKTQKNLEKLFSIGYSRMQHLRFLNRNNKDIVTDKRVYDILHKNFSNFKRK